jgi:hypothetical protein
MLWNAKEARLCAGLRRSRVMSVSSKGDPEGGQWSAWASRVSAAGIEGDGSAGTGVHRDHEAAGTRMIPDAPACSTPSRTTSLTRQTHRTPEPCASVGVRVSRPGCRDPLRALAHQRWLPRTGLVLYASWEPLPSGLRLPVQLAWEPFRATRAVVRTSCTEARGRPCGRPPAAAVLAPAATRRLPASRPRPGQRLYLH